MRGCLSYFDRCKWWEEIIAGYKSKLMAVLASLFALMGLMAVDGFSLAVPFQIWMLAIKKCRCNFFYVTISMMDDHSLSTNDVFLMP